MVLLTRHVRAGARCYVGLFLVIVGQALVGCRQGLAQTLNQCLNAASGATILLFQIWGVEMDVGEYLDLVAQMVEDQEGVHKHPEPFRHLIVARLRDREAFEVAYRLVAKETHCPSDKAWEIGQAYRSVGVQVATKNDEWIAVGKVLLVASLGCLGHTSVEPQQQVGVAADE